MVVQYFVLIKFFLKGFPVQKDPEVKETEHCLCVFEFFFFGILPEKSPKKLYNFNFKEKLETLLN